MTRYLLPALAFFTFAIHVSDAHAVRPDLKRLPIGFAPHEARWRGLTALELQPSRLKPEGPIHSLGEWEDAEAVMTLWTNPAYVKALAQHGPVKLVADTQTDVRWWSDWLRSKGIPETKVSYFVTPTDTIWVRDYGPWWIVDGAGRVGMVDTVYNRPRPLDDKFPAYVSQTLGIPRYEPGLVHTGGNYYSDGLGNAFSSTLVFRENSKLAGSEVLTRMLQFLGIERYTTTPLGAQITIEHLDTFGKLVAPDTWVVGLFPENTSFYRDTEKLVALLQGQLSPYGTPYKIFRLKMIPRGGSDYRAYLNSFISNRALFFPSYGDAADQEAAAVYQAALPGYKIVPVDNGSTGWGDSVHCRSRNLIRRDTLFIFPRVVPQKAGAPTRVLARVIPSPASSLTGAPKINWALDGVVQPPVEMRASGEQTYIAELPRVAPGRRVELYVAAADTRGSRKTAPINAPHGSIGFEAAD
ncbi:MAG TPA: agmatine deiminase family protein [Bdellovibrionales bacterium]|nr:agmatine deiminase family protein [Bdellovibrionales bacterium]